MLCKSPIATSDETSLWRLDIVLKVIHLSKLSATKQKITSSVFLSQNLSMRISSKYMPQLRIALNRAIKAEALITASARIKVKEKSE